MTVQKLFYFFLILSFSIEHSFACAPHTTQDVFIARFEDANAQQGNNLQFNLQLKAEKFVFRSIFDEFYFSKPISWQSSFPIKNISKGQLIIGLAYTPDGKKPEQYQIASFTRLNCENDKLIISDPIVSFLAWNKQTSNCAIGDRTKVGILDGFIQNDQAYYLKKLQQKYPSCQQLNAAFPKTVVSDSVQNVQQPSGLQRWWEKLFNWLSAWF